jgi:antitoxin component YwqK of YwqJK toxin-antitoxin module
MKVKTAYLFPCIAFVLLAISQISKGQSGSFQKVDESQKANLNLTYEYQFTSADSSEGVEKSFSNGKPHTEIYFKDRGHFQFVKVYNPKNGKLLKTDTIIDFKKQVGSSITYFPNGNIKEIEHRDTSGTVDMYKGFFEGGGRKVVINYKNGKRNGIMTEYNANGTVKETGKYVNDMREGEFKFYDVRGNLLSSRRFSKDKVVK